MQIYSSPDSISHREVTLLAVMECGLSICLYIAICLISKSILPILIASALAPLLLLRTKFSTKVAISWWIYTFNTLDRIIGGGPLVVATAPLVYPAGVVIRVAATFYGALRHPIWTIRAMPVNWYRQSLCVDFLAIPEVIPTETRYKQYVPTFVGMLMMIPRLRKDIYTNPLVVMIFYISMSGSIILGYVPSVMLRVSFKATALIYMPFVWIAHATAGPKDQLEFRLSRYVNSEVEKTRRWVSAFVLTVLAAKIAIYEGYVGHDYIVTVIKSEKLAQLVTEKIPLWQVTMVSDATLTYLLFYVSDLLLSRIRSGLSVNRLAIGFVYFLSFFRGASAAITVLFAFMIVIVAIVGLH
ncbi:MAG: hypothetical protein JO013_05975 [Alphaproteobacteria bacterium]|nr:hypothetical protein [Alphaproteobacteria bacterium]